MAGTLTQLQFNENGLTEWPNLGPASRVTLLDASKNKLASLPPSLGLLVALVTLNLSGNPRLAALPDEIGELAALESLNVGGCALRELPAALARCAALKAIIAMNNPLVRVSPALLDCPSLIRISLDKCTSIDAGDAETARALQGLRAKCGGAKSGLFKLDVSVRLMQA